MAVDDVFQILMEFVVDVPLRHRHRRSTSWADIKVIIYVEIANHLYNPTILLHSPYKERGSPIFLHLHYMLRCLVLDPSHRILDMLRCRVDP